MSFESEDRREALDRWSGNHDRAVAFLTCTGAGRGRVFDAVGTPSPQEGQVSCQLKRWWMGAERPAGRGFIDVYAGQIYRLEFDQKSNRLADETRRTIICEVKTGRVIAGEVLRQIRRYQAAVSEEKTPNGLRLGDRGNEIMLMCAHTQPLSIAARDLFLREGVIAIDLSSDPDFSTYAPEG